MGWDKRGGMKGVFFGSNESPRSPVSARVKTLLLPVLLSFALASVLSAQSCRELVRDASGRIVQTIERQKQGGGTERAVTRDASGRIIGSSSGTGKCQDVAKVAAPPARAKR